MKLQIPFKGTFPISQHFGENLNDLYKQQGLLGHQGIDFAMPTGTPIFSACNGTVVAVSKDIQKGEGVAILSTDLFEYKGQPCFLDTIYWHMKDQSILVKVGDKIVVGQLIGLSNNTGQTTGPHLHFSVLPSATDGSRRNLAGLGNGYNGNIDPMPYLDLPAPMTTFAHSWNVSIQRVKDFQAKNGLVADGIVGPKTQSVIDKIL